MSRAIKLALAAGAVLLSPFVSRAFASDEGSARSLRLQPENAFIDANGNVGVLCVGATMGFTIIRRLFTECVRASEVLAVDPDFRRRLQAAIGKLPPLQIGRHGQLRDISAGSWCDRPTEAPAGCGTASGSSTSRRAPEARTISTSGDHTGVSRHAYSPLDLVAYLVGVTAPAPEVPK